MKCIYYAGILSEDPKINLEIKNIHKKIIKKNNKLKNFNVIKYTNELGIDCNIICVQLTEYQLESILSPIFFHIEKDTINKRLNVLLNEIQIPVYLNELYNYFSAENKDNNGMTSFGMRFFALENNVKKN